VVSPVKASECGRKRLWFAVTASSAVYNGRLVQERFPVGWDLSCGSRCGLTFGMLVRGKQLRTFDHPVLLVIEEPILTRLKAGDDRMPCCLRMLRCMLTRRTVAASDVPALGTSTEMKPPTVRRSQTFYAPVATRFGSEINSAALFPHFGSSLRRCTFGKKFKAPARSSRYRPFLQLLEPWPPHLAEVSG
jgi:hypothetical protein